MSCALTSEYGVGVCVGVAVFVAVGVGVFVALGVGVSVLVAVGVSVAPPLLMPGTTNLESFLVPSHAIDAPKHRLPVDRVSFSSAAKE